MAVILAKHRALALQMLRYGIGGAALTLWYAVVYAFLALRLDVAPLFANTVAFLAAVILGHVVHSYWTFKGHGNRNKGAIGHLRFLAVNIAGYALNSFWVWWLVEHLHFSPSLPLIPIALVTPWLSFWLNRRWVFG